MKKIRALLLSLLSLVAIITYGCGGGGGAGSSDLPAGEGPAAPSMVQLWPKTYIAQTNAYITLYAKVLDGNGAPVSGVAVRFSNLSTIGSLSSSTAKTDNYGLAIVTVSSPTPGFSTILAEIDNASGVVKDRTSVFFTDRERLEVSMVMDVDSVPGNGTYNESSDFILLENPSDDSFKVRVTVYDAGGNPVSNTPVIWSSSHEEVSPVRTDLQTNSNGQAEAIFEINPSSIRNTETTINIMATAGNGAANMVTLFLRPVTISPTLSRVMAYPDVVNLGGTSTITAAVFTNVYSPAPDNTTINFTATCGTVTTPFAQTKDGVATTEFKAPSQETTCTVTARFSSTTIGSASITVKPSPEPLTIIPGSLTVEAGVGGKFTFEIHGGTPPYRTVSGRPEKVCNSSDNDCSDTTDSDIWNGSTITVTVDPSATPGDVILTVYDSSGTTTEATISIVCLLSVTPVTANICENDETCWAGSDSETFTISGGVPPFTVASSDTDVISNQTVSDTSFTVNAVNDSINSDTSVTLTITNNVGCSDTVTVNVINQ